MSFFDFNGGAQSFGFPEQQAQEMPFPDGAPMWLNGQQSALQNIPNAPLSGWQMSDGFDSLKQQVGNGLADGESLTQYNTSPSLVMASNAPARQPYNPSQGPQLPGTGASQIAPNAPQKPTNEPFDDAITSMTDIEYRQWVEADEAKTAAEKARQQAVGASFRNKGLGAQAKDMGDGGMMSLMNMAKGRSGQPQFQDVMQGPQMQLPRGLL